MLKILNIKEPTQTCSPTLTWKSLGEKTNEETESKVKSETKTSPYSGGHTLTSRRLMAEAPVQGSH